MAQDSYQLTKLSDKLLLQRFVRTGDDEAFSLLISRHGPMVLRVCKNALGRHHDAEDAFQAVFLVLARKARSIAWYDSIANWLYGVAWRIARREAKRVSRALERHCDMSDISDARVEPPLDSPAAEESLYPALYQLPSKYRAPLVLCYLEGKTRSEAAKELNVSESAVKGRLERGRDLLRKKLSPKDGAALASLTSGLLAQQIAQSAIPSPILTSLVKTSVSFSRSAFHSMGSSSPIYLAKGELTKMFFVSQLKLATLVLVLVAAGGVAAMLRPQSGSAQKEQVTAPPTESPQNLDDEQRDMLTKRHLQAMIRAVHAYVDDHNGLLPPAAVPNPELPVEKRLSGLVLLLPYLGVRPSYIAEDDPDWLAWHADHQGAQKIFDQIDLTKAWDDPVNLAAAKSIVPEFLTPGVAEIRDEDGFAVSHFAFVRGSRGRDNGMFPLSDQPQLAIPDINDGTSNTLAIGQVNSEFGPWIAAGQSTARFINPPSIKARTPGFGSQHAGVAWFANGDGFTYLFDLAATEPKLVHAVAGRDDGILFDSNGLVRFASTKEWLESSQLEERK